MKVAVFFDRDPDGLGAAAAVGMAWEHTHSCVRYIPAIRNEPPNLKDIDKDTIVYIVDFCYKKKLMTNF